MVSVPESAKSGLVVLFAVFVAAATMWDSSAFAPSQMTTSSLRAALADGAPYLVLCSDSMMEGDDGLLADAGSRLRRRCRTATLDCSAKLPSGKSVYQRLQLRKPNPMLKTATGVFFVIANGGKAQQVPPNWASSAGNLFRYARRTSARRPIRRPASTKALRARCLARRHCALVLSGGGLSGAADEEVKDLARSFRTVTFAVVDASLHKLKFEPPLAGLTSLDGLQAPGTLQLVYIRKNTTQVGTWNAAAVQLAGRGEDGADFLRRALAAATPAAAGLLPLEKVSLAWGGKGAPPRPRPRPAADAAPGKVFHHAKRPAEELRRDARDAAQRKHRRGKKQPAAAAPSKKEREQRRREQMEAEQAEATLEAAAVDDEDEEAVAPESDGADDVELSLDDDE